MHSPVSTSHICNSSKSYAHCSGNRTHSTCSVVTTTDDLVPTNVKTSYARGVAVQYTEHDPLLDVPYTEGRVPRTCHCDRAVV